MGTPSIIHYWRHSGTLRFCIVTLRFLLWPLLRLHPNWHNSKERGVRKPESEHDVWHRGGRGASELTSIFLPPGGNLLQGHKVLPTVLLASLILIQTKQPVCEGDHSWKAYLKRSFTCTEPHCCCSTSGLRATEPPVSVQSWRLQPQQQGRMQDAGAEPDPSEGFEPARLLPTLRLWLDVVGFLDSNCLARTGGAWLKLSAGRLRPVAWASLPRISSTLICPCNRSDRTLLIACQRL